MIQIGIQPIPSDFPDGAADARRTDKDLLSSDPDPAVAEDQTLLVSPPPLPFPRVYPGL